MKKTTGVVKIYKTDGVKCLRCNADKWITKMWNMVCGKCSVYMSYEEYRSRAFGLVRN